MPFNPSDGTQGEQQCGLKAADGIDDGHGVRGSQLPLL
jgi:hypothetical protein